MAQRSRTQRGLATWLADSTTPLFVLDARRKVLFFNNGCERLTGWEAGDVIGQVCDYVSEPDISQVESLTGSLCPPPEVMEGTEQGVPAHLSTRDGEQLARVIRFIPLVTNEGAAERVLGVILPLPAAAQASTASPGHQLHAELAAIRADLRKWYDVTTLVGQSAVFRRILSQIELALQSRVSVHFDGEAGTGREHIARLIHYQGLTPLQAFVPLDCARLTADELKATFERALADSAESELPHLRPGALLFRNVDQLPADLQRDIVERWSVSEQAPPIRLMSDSTQPLEAVVAADRMSDDCFHLLTSLVIRVPPLRERMDDLSLLAQDMLERHNRDREPQVTGLTEDVWAAFRRYMWPGNQEELQAVIREAREATSGKHIGLGDLPFRFRTGQQAQRVNPVPPVELPTLQDRLDEVEREHIRQALDLSGQNKSQAAQRLGITRPKLYRRMQQLGLENYRE